MSEDVHPFELMPTESFIYQDEMYTVLADPTGEFNTYVKVLRERDKQEMEILLPSGVMLTTFLKDEV